MKELIEGLKKRSIIRDSISRRIVFLAALSVVLAISLLAFAGCKSNHPPTDAINGSNAGSPASALAAAPYDAYTAKDGTWAVYWYICGSDIELREDLNYTASGQLREMMSVDMPDYMTVVINAGGAKDWHLNGIDSGVINRLVYKGDTLRLVDTKPLSNMGDPETLADFLTYCNTSYPAEHQVLIIYDHGGGSLYGIAFDDLYNMDSLSLNDVDQVIKARPAASGKYEVAGLSACLMSTIDSIAVFNGYANYLVASEESQLGVSWDYGALLQAIADNREINGAELGIAIADGYYASCEKEGYTSMVTLSVIDMDHADELLTAYNDVGNELLQGAIANGSEYIAAYARACYASEYYGTKNDPADGYDMMDLGNMVTYARDILPNSSGPMLKAIDNAMVYHLTNPMRADGLGISCFFTYSGRQNAYDYFMDLRTSPGFKYFYEYGVSGSLSAEAKDYLDSLSVKAEKPEPLPPPIELGLDNHPLHIGSDGHWVLDLGDKANNVATVFLQVGVYDREDEDYWLTGTTNEIYSDWNKGVFRDKYDNTWGSIDGAFCYVEAISEGDDFVLYRVPVLHNGVQKNLMVAYVWAPGHEESGYYQILGLITLPDDDTNAADAVFEELKVGDVIEPILLYNNRYNFKEGVGFVLEDSEVLWNPRNSITVTKDTSFYDRDNGPGEYMVRFQMIDYSGAVHLSDPGYYHVDPLGNIEAEDMQW